MNGNKLNKMLKAKNTKKRKENKKMKKMKKISSKMNLIKAKFGLLSQLRVISNL
jgi:hypothetical protein